LLNIRWQLGLIFALQFELVFYVRRWFTALSGNSTVETVETQSSSAFYICSIWRLSTDLADAVPLNAGIYCVQAAVRWCVNASATTDHPLSIKRRPDRTSA